MWKQIDAYARSRRTLAINHEGDSNLPLMLCISRLFSSSQLKRNPPTGRCCPLLRVTTLHVRTIDSPIAFTYDSSSGIITSSLVASPVKQPPMHRHMHPCASEVTTLWRYTNMLIIIIIIITCIRDNAVQCKLRSLIRYSQSAAVMSVHQG